MIIEKDNIPPHLLKYFKLKEKKTIVRKGFISHLCDIFDEIKRILRDDGGVYVNLGDSYNSGQEVGREDKSKFGGIQGMHCLRGGMKGYASKCMTMIPSRFAIEMINRGWILRNTIIWFKPNVMPQSMKDRFVNDWEYVFFFTKKQKYWFETQYEPLAQETIEDILTRKNMACLTGEHGSKHYNNEESVYNEQKTGRLRSEFVNLEAGRLKRSVWKIDDDTMIIRKNEIPDELWSFLQSYFKLSNDEKGSVFEICTQPFAEAHFAVFPEELVRIPILASCPEQICVKCGFARTKIYEEIKHNPIEIYRGQAKKDYASANVQNPSDTKRRILEAMRTERKVIGYTECDCEDNKFVSGIVLDPFSGSGTTCLVADKLGRRYIGIELNPEYIKMAEKRIEENGSPLLRGLGL